MDFAWIEINLPKFDKNFDKDTIFIKFWNVNIGKNLGLFKKNNKNLNPLKIHSNINFGISLESK